MQTHDLVQGSPEWHAYRAAHFNASDAPAMMGVSPYKTRSQLVQEYATGVQPEVDTFTQAIFDDGHRYEALARPLAEQIVGQDLYPVVGSDGKYSASFDGLTMAEDINWEHKSLNDELRAVMVEGCTGADLPMLYQVQMEQQCMVSGAGRVLFTASKWDGDELVEARHCWYEANPVLRVDIVAGWAQFEKDVAAYEPRHYAPKPEADAIMALPALAIEIRGEVARSNLPAFQAKAERFIASIRTDLVTDEDFANAEATVKFCEKAEGDLEQAKRAALEQTVDIAELMRTIDHIREQLRAKRLTLQGAVKDKKELIKSGILASAKQAFAEHVAALEAEIAPLRLVFQTRDFAGAAKNKRTLATLQDAVDTELANGKIAVDALAQAVRGRLIWYRENAAGHEFLFADLQNVIQKADDDFQMVVRTRIENHQRAEAEKAERERAEQVRQEQAEVQARVEAERQRALDDIRAREQAAQKPALAALDPAPSADLFPVDAATVTPIDAARAPAPTDDATLRLGQINERLAPIALTAEGLARLGFAHVATDKAAKLYRQSDLLRIVAALQRHLGGVAEQAKAA